MSIDADRLTRLEESQAFAERSAEVLAEHVKALTDRVEALARRVSRLEAALVRVEQGGDQDRDPHAGEAPVSGPASGPA